MNIRAALSGVSGVHVTPFDATGAIDHAKLAEVVDFLAVSGIDNIVTGGNTGEFYALTPAEIAAVYRSAAAANAGRRGLTAGVGRSQREACTLAEAAAKAGADAIMIHQLPDPFAAPKGVIAYTQAVAGVTGLPVILYLRNDAYSDGELADLLGHPAIAAVKYAAPDPLRMAARMRASAGREILWLCGLAEQWAVPFAAAGARGFTSGLVNLWPARCLAIRDALAAGDFATARALTGEIAGFEAMRARQGNGMNVTVVKAAMRLTGRDVGATRAPATPSLTAAEEAELAGMLRAWGLV